MTEHEEKAEKPPKGTGSFCIPRKAIEKLLQHNANASEICAYLVMAKHTDETGLFSSASTKALRTYLGLNQQVGAKNALEKLAHMGLILSAEDWQRRHGKPLPDRPKEVTRAAIRYVLEDFGEPIQSRVWFGNSIVDGVGEFKTPLMDVRHQAPTVARLLLCMQEMVDLDRFGGVRPDQAVWVAYTVDDYSASRSHYGLHIATEHQKTARTGFIHRVLGLKKEPTKAEYEDHKAKFWNALEYLEAHGFFYEAVMVFDGNPSESADAEKVYLLHTRSKYGKPPESEKGVASELHSWAGVWGETLADSDGKFEDRYAVIWPNGRPDPHVIGVYRPRYRVSNNKNAGIASVWKSEQDGKDMALRWLAEAKAEFS